MRFTILEQRAYPYPHPTYLSLVLAYQPDATYQPYVVWTFNGSTETYQCGHYYADLASARTGFTERYRQLLPLD